MTQFAFATIVVHPGRERREDLARSLTTAGFDIIAKAAGLGDIGFARVSDARPLLLILHGETNLQVLTAEIQRFKGHFPSARIALLQDEGQLNSTGIAAAFRAGVDAYFVDTGYSTYVKSLELVMRGGTVLSPAVLSTVLPHADESAPSNAERPPAAEPEPERKPGPQLTERHEAILRHLAEGHPNKVIANLLGLPEGAVKVSVKSMLRLIGVRNRTQAAIWAMNNRQLGEPSPRGEGGEPTRHSGDAPNAQDRKKM